MSRGPLRQWLMGGGIPILRNFSAGTDVRRACLSLLLAGLLACQSVTCQSTSAPHVSISPTKVMASSSSWIFGEDVTNSEVLQPSKSADFSSEAGSVVSTSSSAWDFHTEPSSPPLQSSSVGGGTPVLPSLGWMTSTVTDGVTPSQTVSVNSTDGVGVSLSDTVNPCCDMSSAFSILPSVPVTSPGMGVSLNTSGEGGVTNTPLTNLSVTTPALNLNLTTPGLGFGNGSCSGNVTGCPEYRGKQDYQLSTPVIIGVACGAAAVVIILVGLVIFMLRRRGQLVTTKSESNYWDDNVTLSYINGHMDLPRDFTDEMISLDNDSFLNSLDNMSYTSYPVTVTTKHTVF